MKNIRRISKFVLVVFIANLFVFSKEVQAVQQTPIIGQASASVAQMQKWAISKGATSTFVSLAPKYVKLASEHGGINPVIAYAQSAVETGYGKFGKVVNESYHNPCGLKTRAGGDNSDPNAHQRFANWDQGISAHLDHLALYAGANGYPRSNTYDPRHFASIKGKAVYVEQLSGAWATDKEYAGKILRLKSEIEETIASKIMVDTPVAGSENSGSMKVSGWSIDSSGVSKVSIFIDGKYIKDLNVGIPRNDVNSAYPGYPGGDKSGFEGVVNISSLAKGNHLLKVVSRGKNGIETGVEYKININKKDPKGFLESPSYGENATSKVKISGWALNDSGVKSVKVYFNDQYQCDLKYGSSRKDVNNAYPEYKNSLQSGFSGEIATAKYTDGKYNVKVVVEGNDGVKSSYQTEIKISKKKSIAFIEEPAHYESVNGKTRISGWALNGYGVKEIKAYVDGEYNSTLKYGYPRADVAQVYPNYPDGNHSGFQGDIDLSKYNIGKHQIRIDVYGKNDKKDSYYRDVKIEKKVSRGFIEAPIYGENVGNSIKVSGWALNDSGVTKIKAYLDGKYISDLTIGIKRQDVENAYPGYYNGINSGFSGNMDIKEFNPGKHELRLDVYGKDNSKDSYSTLVNVKRKPYLGFLESPSNGSSVVKNFKVSGWALNDSGVVDANVYIDGKHYSKLNYGENRSDVNSLYPGYLNGLKCGYSGSVDIDGFEPGNHEVRVDILGRDGTKNSYYSNIRINKDIPRSFIETPGYNQQIKDSMYVSGWAVNDSGIKEVKAYINDRYVQNLMITGYREDVNDAYTAYNNLARQYSGTLDLGNCNLGNNKLKIEAIGIDGTKSISETIFRIEGKKTIVIDPGHRLFGSDTGASATHAGINYNEAELDLQTANKLKSELEQKGYNVVMTQTLNNMISADTTLQSLKKRVQIAESNKADLFVSIHHNSYDNADAYGTEVWYSNPKSSSISPQAGAAKAGQDLAYKVAKSIASSGGFYNRGSKNNDFYVTYNTTMPSILVEAGFLTNPGDAKKAADSSNQWKVAKGMAGTIDTFMKNR